MYVTVELIETICYILVYGAMGTIGIARLSRRMDVRNTHTCCSTDNYGFSNGQSNMSMKNWEKSLFFNFIEEEIEERPELVQDIKDFEPNALNCMVGYVMKRMIEDELTVPDPDVIKKYVWEEIR